MAQDDLSTLIKHPQLLELLAISNQARDQLQAILDAYCSDDAQGQDDDEQRRLQIAKASRELVAQITLARSQNRRIAHTVREVKAETSASRAEVDHLHLQLQNLYYEQRHLRGEIENCENFPHPYMELPLIPLAEFFARQPHWLEEGRVDEQGNGPDEQELMRAQIEEEYNERVELKAERDKLHSRKLELERANVKRKEKLGKLDKDLEAFMEAAKPIEATFEQEY